MRYPDHVQGVHRQVPLYAVIERGISMHIRVAVHFDEPRLETFIQQDIKPINFEAVGPYLRLLVISIDTRGNGAQRAHNEVFHTRPHRFVVSLHDRAQIAPQRLHTPLTTLGVTTCPTKCVVMTFLLDGIICHLQQSQSMRLQTEVEPCDIISKGTR